jgi:CRP/FNR family transcriptional regulator, anaerobic regulatory protein
MAAGGPDLPHWLREFSATEKLDADATEALSTLKSAMIPERTELFRPGARPAGFLLVIEGRVGVYLLGRSGREMLLYTVTRGETCVQTTLGLLGEEPYSAEAIAETDLVAVMVPIPMFERLMASSSAFRAFVFRAFAARVGDLMFMLEQVAFVRVESRLARMLFERADAEGRVSATHQELAVAIGSAREVVTRQLHGLASRGLVSLDRGAILITDRAGLSRLGQESG